MTHSDPPAGGVADSGRKPFLSAPPRRHRPRLELVSFEGSPSDTEKKAIEKAVGEVVAEERRQREGSLWMRAGRAQGRRLGMSDYRDRFSREDVWRLSARFPYGGREYPGLVGRGDTR